ncbi:AT-hook motif nuclear-localized protein 10 [Hibiscus syriacus]|uniref:AT-hook motif nuclear-localized protein n=1 Tax=Hibiscus syriacus TaxID=106335 RepID=A0A6A2YLY5_HIBSY|nr:AT-hook motif nuclear-localized protein 10 [Hibiscus syriacus]
MSGSETGLMATREPYSLSMQQTSPVASQPVIQNMRLAFSADGTAMYKPLASASPTYQPQHASGGGGADGSAGGLAVTQGQGQALNMSMSMGSDVTQSNSGGGFPSPTPQPPPSGGSASSPTSTKKPRGRPPGSLNKPKLDALGSSRVGFTPHVVTVKVGEDVSSKIMSFSQHGPRAICILSANGAISNVTLCQPATSGGTVTYEGRFEILSLSGSFLLSENGGQRSRTGGLSVSLSGPDGRVLGGGVAGLLTAASPVQVVLGTFIADNRKDTKTAYQKEDLSIPPKLAPGVNSSPSHGTLSESSGGPVSPVNQSMGACNDNNPHGKPSAKVCQNHPLTLTRSTLITTHHVRRTPLEHIQAPAVLSGTRKTCSNLTLQSSFKNSIMCCTVVIQVSSRTEQVPMNLVNPVIHAPSWFLMIPPHDALPVLISLAASKLIFNQPSGLVADLCKGKSWARNILDVGVSQNAFLFRVALPSMRIDQSKLKCEIQRDGQGIVTQGTEVLWGLSRKCETRNETFCSPGPFTISFTLPGAVDPRLFSPTFRPDGILEVEVLRNNSGISTTLSLNDKQGGEIWERSFRTNQRPNVIAVKVMDQQEQGNPSKALIYEFMHNGSFNGCMRRIKHEILDWLGFSQNLSNIFSEDSTTTNRLKGTIGYAAPEYDTGTEAATTGDMYSFGILLLEIFTSKRPIESPKDRMDIVGSTKELHFYPGQTSRDQNSDTEK